MINETFQQIVKLMQTRSLSSASANKNSEYVDMMAIFDTRKKINKYVQQENVKNVEREKKMLWMVDRRATK
jgi:hypothetical protein